MVTKTFKWAIVSGTCKCGHSWEDHHGNIIMNEDTLESLPSGHPPILPGECESGGKFSRDCDCNGYRDIYNLE